jgi:DNA-binding Lrp family transcriptional regulator
VGHDADVTSRPSGAPEPLDPLDRRIVAALQVDGRAPWHRIAEVLDESERTVTRRGTALLESNVVRVSTLSGHNSAVLVRAESAIGSVRSTTTALSQRSDCVYAYALTGAVDCVAEIRVGPSGLAGLVLDELPATIGLVRAHTDPVLRVLQSVRQWRPPILTPHQIAALEVPPFGVQQPSAETAEPLSTNDRAIARGLAEDGRATVTTLARQAGVSESTARRRLEWMLANGHLWSRAVVEPAHLGYPVEAMLWIRLLPGQLDTFTTAVVGNPYVREALCLAGEFDLAVNVAVPDEATLYDLVSGPWRDLVQTAQVSVVLQAMKRSGLRTPL